MKRGKRRSREAAAAMDRIVRRLGVRDSRSIEMESKWRVPPGRSNEVFRHLLKRDSLRYIGSRVFHDRFLDTPSLDLLGRGASLRLRYKRDGTKACLQYKGPGFRKDGVLFRPEFSSGDLAGFSSGGGCQRRMLLRADAVRRLLSARRGGELLRHLRRDMGGAVVGRIGPLDLVCTYHKEKFGFAIRGHSFEPSLDRIVVVRTSGAGAPVVSVLCEFENEIRPARADDAGRLEMVAAMGKFDRALAGRFGLRAERRDKYGRCAGCVGWSSRGGRTKGRGREAG